jgi:hypothetical protein
VIPRSHRLAPRAGAALIVVLGMLTVITILAVAFAIAMRFEQLTARHFADEIRARQFLDVAVLRAVEGVNRVMESQPGGFAYPFWGDFAPTSFAHVCVSIGVSGKTVDLFTGSVTNLAPFALWDDITHTAPGWLYAVGQDPDTGHVTTTNGRIAFMVVNVSGLIDANTCIVATNVADRFAPGVIDASFLDDLADPDRFAADREAHRHYETPAELAALNRGVIPPLSNLFTYAYDPNPRQFIVSTNKLGWRDIALTNRFDVNALTNYTDYSGAAFSNEYLHPLTEHLRAAGVTNALAAAWNVINFIDPDRYPHTGTATPWLEDFGNEAIPLINEIALYRVTDAAATNTNAYAVAVEVWYPFVPRPLAAADGYVLQVAVFKEFVSGVAADKIMDHGTPAWSFESPIPDMTADDTNAFFVAGWPQPASKQPIAFPVKVTTPGIGANPSSTRTQFLPIGVTSYTTYPTDNTPLVVTVTNRVWILARIVNGEGRPVDESMGYDPSAQEGEDHALYEFRAEAALAVDDPRMNGRTAYWKPTTNSLGTTTNTLGTTNAVASFAATPQSQGLPVYHPDGSLSNLVDIGQVFLPEAGPWHTFDLLDGGRGQAALLDRLTTVPAVTNAPWAYGLVNPNSRHPAVLQAILGPPELEQPVTLATNRYAIDSNAFARVAEAMIMQTSWPYAGFADMFDSSDRLLADALAACAPSNQVATTDYQREYLLRPLVRKVSFRQNLLLVIVAADALSPDGLTVMARRRGVALIYRDAYTGNWFVKQFFELMD